MDHYIAAASIERDYTKWLIVTVVMALVLFVFTAYVGASMADEPEESPAAAGERAQTDDPIKVVCENGVMLGQLEDGVISFKGVPYAKPPVGDLLEKAYGDEPYRVW